MLMDSKARNEIIETGRRVWMRGLVAANDGNLSMRLGKDRILITPTGVSKGFMNAADLVICDLAGEVLSPHHRKVKPTTELPMHLEIYRQRPDIHGVVHAHPPMATAFAAAGLSLKECLLAETALLLGHVPLAPYATPSTQEVPASIRPLVKRCDALLLANHGAVTYGSSLKEAHFKMETLEHSAKVTYYARALGTPTPLSSRELARLEDLKESTYGLKTRTLGPEAPPNDPAAGTDGSSQEELVRSVVESVVKRLLKR